MNIGIVIVILLVMGFVGVMLNRQPHLVVDADESRDYADLKAAGSSMSRRTFQAIRQKNRAETEQFGNGDHAPHWPSHKWNGQYTLHRGVWVEDCLTVPSARKLDQLRRDYRASHRIVKYTLVEGEQEAPMGQNGKLIRVVATRGIPSEISNSYGQVTGTIPMVTVSPVDKADGYWVNGIHGDVAVRDVSVDFREYWSPHG